LSSKEKVTLKIQNELAANAGVHNSKVSVTLSSGPVKVAATVKSTDFEKAWVLHTNLTVGHVHERMAKCVRMTQARDL